MISIRLSPILRLRWMFRSRARALAWDRYIRDGTLALGEGRLVAAERNYIAALAAAEGAAPDDPRLRVSLGSLVGLYRRQSRYEEAAPLCARLLALQERSLGPAHKDLAATLGDLAEIDRALGRPGAAVKHRRRALAILEHAIGADLPELEESLRRSRLSDPDQSP